MAQHNVKNIIAFDLETSLCLCTQIKAIKFYQNLSLKKSQTEKLRFKIMLALVSRNKLYLNSEKHLRFNNFYHLSSVVLFECVVGTQKQTPGRPIRPKLFHRLLLRLEGFALHRLLKMHKFRH